MRTHRLSTRRGPLARTYRLYKWRLLAKLSGPDNRTVSALVHGKPMDLDLSDRVLSERLYTDGFWEASLTAYLMTAIQPGMTVVDIGANIGYFTLLAAEKVGAAGLVVAFEPEPSRFALLQRNIRANGFTNVIPVQQAVSSHAGTARLYLDPTHNKGDHRLFEEREGREFVEVETTRLDDFVKTEKLGIDVIKMDIQGAEMAALEGMAETIMTSPALTLITEFWPEGMQRFGTRPDAFLSRLAALRCRIHVLDEETHALQEIQPESVLARCARAHPEVNLVCKKGPGETDR